MKSSFLYFSAAFLALTATPGLCGTTTGALVGYELGKSEMSDSDDWSGAGVDHSAYLQRTGFAPSSEYDFDPSYATWQAWCGHTRALPLDHPGLAHIGGTHITKKTFWHGKKRFVKHFFEPLKDDTLEQRNNAKYNFCVLCFDRLGLSGDDFYYRVDDDDKKTQRVQWPKHHHHREPNGDPKDLCSSISHFPDGKDPAVKNDNGTTDTSTGDHDDHDDDDHKSGQP